MLFSTTIFLFVFLPAVLIGYYLVFRSIRWKNYFLLLASLLFYAWGEPLYVFLMLASVAGNFGLGLLIGVGVLHLEGQALSGHSLFKSGTHAGEINVTEGVPGDDSLIRGSEADHGQAEHHRHHQSNKLFHRGCTSL